MRGSGQHWRDSLRQPAVKKTQKTIDTQRIAHFTFEAETHGRRPGTPSGCHDSFQSREDATRRDLNARTPPACCRRGPHRVLGPSRAGYFTLNVRHFVVAAACAAVLAIVARMW